MSWFSKRSIDFGIKNSAWMNDAASMYSSFQTNGISTETLLACSSYENLSTLSK